MKHVRIRTIFRWGLIAKTHGNAVGGGSGVMGRGSGCLLRSNSAIRKLCEAELNLSGQGKRCGF